MDETTNYKVHDSGNRQSFVSGAQRDRGGDKPRPDLISPFFMERLGRHLLAGAKKYSAWNWAHGMPNSEHWASLMRHVTAAAQGDTSEDHLAAIAFNVMAIIHNQEMIKLGYLHPKFNDWPIDWKKHTYNINNEVINEKQ